MLVKREKLKMVGGRKERGGNGAAKARCWLGKIPRALTSSGCPCCKLPVGSRMEMPISDGVRRAEKSGGRKGRSGPTGGMAEGAGGAEEARLRVQEDRSVRLPPLTRCSR